MKCEICGDKNPSFIALLPIVQKNGSLCTMACRECMSQSHAYCKKHDMIHMGFVDGTTACPSCIADLRNENITIASSLGTEILSSMEVSDAEDLSDLIVDASEFTGWSAHVVILNYLATKAMRTGQSVREVANRVIEHRSANYILQ